MANGEGIESQVGELQATPGYMDGTMKQNDSAQYDRITGEITKLYEQGGAATGAGQTGLDGATTGETSSSLESRAKELQATPGYMDGSLRNSNPEGYKKLQAQITDLFARSGEAEIPTLQAASEATMALVESQTALMDAANKELAALKSMGFEQTRLPNEILPHHIEAWRGQRLLAAENYTELQPLLTQGLKDIETPPAHIQALSMFLSTDDFDPKLRSQIVEKVVEFVFMAKHYQATGEIK